MKPVPAAFSLPYGYEVTVKRGDCGDAWGDWDDETRTITLDSTLRKPAEIRFIFLHEADHAWKDWLRWVARTRGVVNPDGPAAEPAEEGEP